MALILILACAAIAILEIYLARGARELERRVGDQERRAETADARLTEIRSGLERIDDRSALAEQGLAETRGTLGRLSSDLDEQFPGETNLTSRLTVLEQEAETEGIRRRLIRALDQQADAALGGTTGPVIVRGAIYADGTPGLVDSLVRRYELCAEEYGLTTELRTPWRGSGMYYLSCADPRLVEAAFLEQVRRLRNGELPEDSLHSLLNGLRELPSGLVQLGSFVAARTPDAYRCAVLTPQEGRRFRAEPGPGGPSALLETLAGATEQRGCDLLGGP
jgi:hypothetical protein